MIRTATRSSRGVEDSSERRPQIAVLLAGLGAVVGPLLPWLAPGDAGSQSGIDFVPSGAWIALGIGLLILFAALYNLAVQRVAGFGEVLCGILGCLALGGVALYGFDQARQAGTEQAGIGLWVLLAAACLLGIGALWHAFTIGRGRQAVGVGGGMLAMLLAALVIVALVPGGGSPPAHAPLLGTPVGTTGAVGVSSASHP